MWPGLARAQQLSCSSVSLSLSLSPVLFVSYTLLSLCRCSFLFVPLPYKTLSRCFISSFSLCFSLPISTHTHPKRTQCPHYAHTTRSIASQRIALQRIALQRIALQRIALHRIALHRIALDCMASELKPFGAAPISLHSSAARTGRPVSFRSTVDIGLFVAASMFCCCEA